MPARSSLEGWPIPNAPHPEPLHSILALAGVCGQTYQGYAPMTVTVSFVTTKGIGSTSARAISACRVSEDLALTETTTATIVAGEVAIVTNSESSTVRVAFGGTPDADAAESDEDTSAGVALPAGTYQVFMPAGGDKINVKAIS